jgi:hypothetical protein
VPADTVPDAQQSLYGVASISRTDAWAVGSDSYPDRTDPMVQHWNGVTWTRVALPAGLVDAALNAVEANGPDDVWAAGFLTGDAVTGQPSEPLVLHWNGLCWSRIALPSTADLGLARLNGITVSGGQVWAVGESTIGGATNRKPLAFRVTASGAIRQDTPDEQGQLNGVTIAGAEVWAVGYRYEDGLPLSYALRRRSDGVWERAAAPEAPGATLFDVTTVPRTQTLWTAGAMDGVAPGLPAPLLARGRN